MNKLLTKIFKKENIIKMLFIFMIIQPLLDVYYLYTLPNLSGIFTFSPATIIRFIFFGIMCLVAFITIKNKNKYKSLLVFSVVVLLYTIFHHFNCINYDNKILGENTYSIVTELFYIARMIMPLCLIYISYNFELSDKKISKALFIISAIFSFTMIITNLFLIAIPSYDGATHIKINFLQWFTPEAKNIKFIYIASKGIFHMANQISATFILILPLIIYYFNKKQTFLRFIIIISLILSMNMLGTRVASYGAIIICLVMFIMYAFFCIIKKDYNKKNKLIYINLIFIAFSIFIYSFSPVNQRNFTFSGDGAIATDENLQKNMEEKINERDKANFIKENSYSFSIHSKFTNEIYPADKHLDFWIKILELPYEERNTDRKIQLHILKDAFDRNSSIIDNFLGIGSSRIRNSKLYVEKDFIVHYYILGIVGLVIFILPYIIILIYCIIKMLANYKRYFNYKNCTFVFACILTLICSLYSGNVLDELIVTIYLGIIIGILLKNVNNKENHTNTEDSTLKVSVIVPVYNVEEYLEKCLDSLVNQTIDNYEIIVVNDGSKDNSQSIINRYQEKYPEIIKSYIKQNGGLSDARNYGLKFAKGEYIAFLDSDDYVDINMYELMYNKAKSNDFDIVVCNVRYVYDDKSFLSDSKIYYDIFDSEIKNQMIDIYPAAWNKIYKRSIFGKIKFKKNVWFEDVEYLYRVFPNIKSIGVVEKALINYRQREGAITRTFDDRVFHQIDNWNGIIKFYKKKNLYKEYKKELEYCYVRYLYATLVSHAFKYNDHQFFLKILDECEKNVKRNFFNYKKNKYFYLNGMRGFYLLFYNKKIINKLYKYKHNIGGNK